MINSERLEEGAREWQNDVVRNTLAEVTAGPLVTMVVAMGRAADVLPRHVLQADLLVLGAPRFRSRPIVRRCRSLATCPVVVIHGDQPQ